MIYPIPSPQAGRLARKSSRITVSHYFRRFESRGPLRSRSSSVTRVFFLFLWCLCGSLVGRL